VLKKYILKSCKKNCLNIWLVKSQKKQIREIFLKLFLQKKIQKKIQKELVCLEATSWLNILLPSGPDWPYLLLNFLTNVGV
jgi:hypothetical protein